VDLESTTLTTIFQDLWSWLQGILVWLNANPGIEVAIATLGALGAVLRFVFFARPHMKFTAFVARSKMTHQEDHTVHQPFGILIENKSHWRAAHEVQADLQVGAGSHVVTLFRRRSILRKGGGAFRNLNRLAISLDYNHTKKEVGIMWVEKEVDNETTHSSKVVSNIIEGLPTPITLTLHGENLQDKDREPKEYTLWFDSKKEGELRFEDTRKWAKDTWVREWVRKRFG
jgi:hypothetical protein